MSKYKDPNSWGYGGVKRRDFQHSHDGPEELPGKKKSKKLGRKRARCKHDYELSREVSWPVGSNSGRVYTYRYFLCTKCGRKEMKIIVE